MNGGIYKLWWKTCPDYYIGGTGNFQQRKWNHFGTLRRRTQRNTRIQKVYEEHGLPEFEILLCCEKEDLYENEKFYLQQSEGDPNCANIFFDPNSKGHKQSEEQRRRVGEFHKGKIISEEQRREHSIAMKGENNPNFGKTLGEHHCARKVINTESGEIHGSAKELVVRGLVTVGYSYLGSMLRGRKPNKTPYRYLDTIKQEENFNNQ